MKKQKMIEQEIRDMILQKKWKVGEKIPSFRSFARKFQTSTQTMVSVMKQLEQNGYIRIVPNIGCFILEKNKYEIHKQVKTILKNYSDVEKKSTSMINFCNTLLLSKEINERSYLFYLQKILATEGMSLENSNKLGLPSLIRCLSDKLEEENIFTLEENIFITTGSETSIAMICRIFSDRKKLSMALSDPSHYNIINTLAPWVHIQGVHLLENGWDFEDFHKILSHEKIDFVFVSPNFQNPSGVSWSEEKKIYLLELAEKYDFYIIEEDNYSRLHYQKEMATSFKSLERIGKERIFYIRDFSSLFGSTLKISCVLVPPKFRDLFLMEKLVLSATPSNIQQKVLEFLLVEGYFDFFMKRLKQKLYYRSQYLIYLLEKIPELKIMHKAQGGFFIWIKLEKAIDEDVFYELCKEKGVLILPGYIFYKDQRNHAKFRICFASNSLHEIQLGVQKIQEVISYLKH